MKYRIYNILLSFLLLSIMPTAHAQLIPEFEFTLYLQDEEGNQDSIIIGYDSLALETGLNTQFGETDITNQPWDSLFEVRVSNAFDSSFGKKRICYYWCNDDSHGVANWVNLEIRTNSSITLSWDKQKFIDSCHIHSVVAENPAYFQYPLFNFGQIRLSNTTTHTYYYPILSNDTRVYTASIEGGGVDSIFHLTMGFIYDIDLLINTKEAHKKDLVKVYPNPVQTQLNIQLNEGTIGQYIEIYNITGQQVWHSPSKANQYQVHTMDWAKGIYFYKIQTTDGVWTSGKFVKY